MQHNLYNAQPQIAKPGNTIHNVFLPPPGSMLPNPYLSMPSLMNYPSQFQMAPVQLQPGRPNEHLRGSLQDQEQVDMHRMVYFNQQGITLPLMHPQVSYNLHVNIVCVCYIWTRCYRSCKTRSLDCMSEYVCIIMDFLQDKSILISENSTIFSFRYVRVGVGYWVTNAWVQKVC